MRKMQILSANSECLDEETCIAIDEQIYSCNSCSVVVLFVGLS
jgi:hypothetical protein